MNLLGRIFGRQADYRSAIIEDQEHWILVKKGSSQSLMQAVIAYGNLYPARVPQPCTVVVTHSAQGFFGLRFLDRAPAYNFLNLIGWLNRPPDIPGVSGAIGWYRSPATRIKYALYPDPANHWGDTLIGYNNQDQAVSVYLPDAALCEISRRVKIQREPVLSSLGHEEQGRVTVIFNADRMTGNFNFVVTHAKDHTWV